VNIEVVRDHMYRRILQCLRENRQPWHFAASPDTVTFLRAHARPETTWLIPDMKNPERLTAFGVPVLEEIGWSTGWLLFDRNRKPVDDEIIA
jgi:hypothetical protein